MIRTPSYYHVWHTGMSVLLALLSEEEFGVLSGKYSFQTRRLRVADERRHEFSAIVVLAVSFARGSDVDANWTSNVD